MVSPNALIRRCLRRAERPGAQSVDRAIEVDGAGLLAQVKRNCRSLVNAQEGGGQKVLAMVLLHVIKAASPIDDALDFAERPRRRIHEMKPLTIALLRIQHRYAVQSAPVSRLTAALSVEGGAVQHHRQLILVLKHSDDPRVELGQVAVKHVE